MENLSVTVTHKQAEMIRAKVKDGSFDSADDVIAAALDALQRTEQDHEERLNAIRADIDAVLADDSGDVSLEEAFEQMTRHIHKLAGETNDPTPEGRF